MREVTSPIAVLKFGGTSVKNIGRIRHVAEIVKSFCSGQKVIVVVSAMGDTTDHLSYLAQQCCEDPDKRELDVLLSTGEQVSIALLTLVLKDAGIKARSFTGAQIGILTAPDHGCADIRHIDADSIAAAIKEYDVLVVAGFQGVTDCGDITTLGRGGSDTTAVALAAAVNAGECHVFTDVDGVFNCDPNKFAAAELYGEIDYESCLALVEAGAQVMHDRAVRLASQHRVSVRVRNTFKPDHPGTLIRDLIVA